MLFRKFAALLIVGMLASFSGPAFGDFVDKLPPAPTPIPVKPKKAAPQQGAGSKKAGPKAKEGGAGSQKNSSSAPPQPADSNTGGLISSGEVFKHDVSAPLTYGADEMDGSRKEGIVELKMNVVIVQGETTLKADKAEIFMEKETTNPRKVVSKGNVKLEKKTAPKAPTLHAEADEIEYFVNERKAILRGKPKIWKGKELLRGEVIELDLATEGIKVKNPSGVVDPKSAKSGEGGSEDASKKKPR